jgi:hypothetical protein
MGWGRVGLARVCMEWSGAERGRHRVGWEGAYEFLSKIFYFYI